MKIYTKKGDKGKTSLIGGKRVSKNDSRIEAYGTIDELIGHIGLIRDSLNIKELKDFLLIVQDRLMTCAAIMATDCENCNSKIPKLNDEDILIIEEKIDEIEKNVEPLHSLILPGGYPSVSQCHIARSVCRRAERNCIKVAENFTINNIVIRYLNRLSDYLFMLARKISKELNVEEIKWKPKL